MHAADATEIKVITPGSSGNTALVLRQLGVGGTAGWWSATCDRNGVIFLGRAITRFLIYAQFLDHMGMVRLPWNWHHKMIRGSLKGSPFTTDWTMRLLGREGIFFVQKNTFVILGYFLGYFGSNVIASYS